MVQNSPVEQVRMNIVPVLELDGRVVLHKELDDLQALRNPGGVLLPPRGRGEETPVHEAEAWVVPMFYSNLFF